MCHPDYGRHQVGLAEIRTHVSAAAEVDSGGTSSAGTANHASVHP